MKNIKRITALIIALLLLFTAAQADWAPAGENSARFSTLLSLLDDSVREDAVYDPSNVDAVLEEIRKESEDDYDIARAIVDHWNATVLDMSYRMFAYKGQETAYALENSGLDFSGNHAFVVLGYQLEDGEMQPELIGRCEAAAAAARSFPDSILITTGGATGPNNPDMHTEAEMMKDYLVNECGIHPYRIFTDPEAMTTLENAVNSLEIMRERRIETYTVVTSNYHQRWSQVLFNAMAAVSEKETGYCPRMVGNFNYMARPSATRTSGVRMGLSQLASLFGRPSWTTSAPAEKNPEDDEKQKEKPQ